MPDNSNYQFRAVPLNLIEYVTKKPKSSTYYFRYLLDRTIKMFKYKNLPETIDQNVLERYLQVNGTACITRANDGNLYCFNGSWGGEQDVYYRPTRFIISNPHVSQLTEETFHKECVIYGDEEHTGVLLRNDTEWASLTPLIGRYAVLMCENTLTVRTADIMLRIIALLSAGTDKARKSAEAYIKKLENGELSIIGDSNFMESSIHLQSPPSNNGSYLTQFIELQQYLKGSFFNELGLRANYNMNREAIGQGESTLDADSILPLCDNMLECRKEDIAKVNALFGTDISVDFSSAWLENRIESSINIVSQLTEAGLTNDNGGDAQVGSSWDNMGLQEKTESSLENAVEGDDTNDAERSEVGKESSVAGGTAERTGDENSEIGKSSERGVSGEGTEGVEETNGSNGDFGGAGEENREDGTEDGKEDGKEVTDEEINEVKDELNSDELSIVEAVNEIVVNKISQLTAKARKDGDEDDVSET